MDGQQRSGSFGVEKEEFCDPASEGTFENWSQSRIKDYATFEGLQCSRPLSPKV